MNDPRDPDATIAFWLEDGPQRLPESTKRAIAVTTRTIRQSRRPSWMPWRSPNVNGLMRVALAATAVVAVAVGALYLTGVNRNPSPPAAGQGSASPSPIASPSAASPVISPVPRLPGLIAFSRVNLGSATIMVAAPDGSRTSTLISGLAQNVQPAWSPDGTEIAWATMQRDPGRPGRRNRRRLADERRPGPQSGVVARRIADRLRQQPRRQW